MIASPPLLDASPPLGERGGMGERRPTYWKNEVFYWREA
jgi:hypothetical protein